VADADLAVAEFDGARRWLAAARAGPMEPFGAEVWVFDPDLTRVVLVRHRWRGWVPPGGRVEPGEAPREAAARELFEETGLRAELRPEPAAVAVRSYCPGCAPTLGLSYAAIVDPATPLAGEPGQPVAWLPLDRGWDSIFPADLFRMRGYVTWLAVGGPGRPGDATHGRAARGDATDGGGGA